MESLIRRTARAARHAQKQAEKVREREKAEIEWKWQAQARQVRATVQRHIREARAARREDWERGALAPRRDTGEKADVYGTMEMYDMNLLELPKEKRLKWWPISARDRVVVVRGREKGRIGMVWRVNKERNSVEINDINVVDFFVPAWIPRPEGDDRTVVAHSQALPLEDVRLVYPLPDPETGVLKDVVIDKLVPLRKYPMRGGGYRRSDERIIAGTNTIIPRPAKPDEEKPERHAADSGAQPFKQTFKPILLQHPMPASVIDELRGKYSRFRTRHDWDFAQRMKAIDAREERRKELPKSMRTPVQEMAELKARQKAAQEKELSPEQLAKIGEVMAVERAKAVDGVKGMAR